MSEQNETKTLQPSLIDMEQAALSVRNEMQAIRITDQTSYNLAVDARTRAAHWLKDAKAWFKGMKDPAYAAWKKICDNEKSVCDLVESTVKQINAELIRYDNEQERIRREEQRRIDEEARKEAEAQRLADAVHLESQGATPEVVEAMLDTPIVAPAAIVAAPTYEKSSAVTYRDNWQGECFDLHALVKAAAKDKSKLALLQINQPALTQMARAMKETLAEAYPGCRAVNNRTIATGRG